MQPGHNLHYSVSKYSTAIPNKSAIALFLMLDILIVNICDRFPQFMTIKWSCYDLHSLTVEWRY